MVANLSVLINQNQSVVEIVDDIRKANRLSSKTLPKSCRPLSSCGSDATDSVLGSEKRATKLVSRVLTCHHFQTE